MFVIPKTTQDWFRGILTTAINAAATGVTLIIAAPDTFNWQAGRAKLLSTTAALTVVAVANYLKSNPLPPESTSTMTITQTSTGPAPAPAAVIVTGTGDGKGPTS